MISLGSLLWIVGIGALVFFMMRKRGGCCGGVGGHESHKIEMDDRSQDNDKENPRGGCCG
jgi:hypothetical protein